MFDFELISRIYKNFFEGKEESLYSSVNIEKLIYQNIQTNKNLWDLEDSARMRHLGTEHVAEAKQKIDKQNHCRNDQIRAMDRAIALELSVTSLASRELFYSESPGMIIDRLAILHLKFFTIKELIELIEEDDLRADYRTKEQIIQNQINNIGNFIDRYVKNLKTKKVYYEIQEPVKIYNDERVRKYIKLK